MSLTQVRELCSDAETLIDADQAELALGRVTQAIEVASRLGESGRAALAMATVIKAWVEESTQDKEAAVASAHEALLLANSLSEVDFDQKIVVLKHVSHLLAKTSNPIESSEIANNILKMLEKWFSPSHPLVALTRQEMAAWTAI